jgi:hypothetical protein
VSVLEAIVLLLELGLRLNLPRGVLLAREICEADLDLCVRLLQSSVVLGELGKLPVHLFAS